MRKLVLTIVCLAVANAAWASQSPAEGSNGFNELPRVQLAANADTPAGDTRSEKVEVETTTVEAEADVVHRRQGPDPGTEWDIWAPIRLRSANPQDLGQVQILQTAGYSTSSDGTDDDVRTRLQIEYGFAPDHQLSLAVPMLLGDGDAEGNANLELGWQWRLWDEKDALPAFALLNELFIPSGSHAGGLDWRLTGLLTKSITDRWRLHLNPFLTVASGDSPQPRDKQHPGDLRDFQWGFVAGTDYMITDNLSLMLDYVHEASEYEGSRNQHYMEVGTMWSITERHGLAASTRWTLDGDDVEDNWGAALTYSYSFNAPAIGK